MGGNRVAYDKYNWLPRLGTGLNKFRDLISGQLFEFEPEPDSITQEGTPFGATMMNHIEDGLYQASLGCRAFYGVCSTPAATSGKTVTITEFNDQHLIPGTIVAVKFSDGNSASSPTLNVNNTGAKAIKCNNWAALNKIIDPYHIALLQYDGTYWQYINAPPVLVELVRFTSSGTFDPAQYPSAGNLYYIVAVGGGGGGGGGRGDPGTDGDSGGGGGGGGVVAIMAIVTSSQSVTIGAGGAGGARVTSRTSIGNGGGGGGFTQFGGIIGAPGGGGGAGAGATTVSGVGGNGAGTGGGAGGKDSSFSNNGYGGYSGIANPYKQGNDGSSNGGKGADTPYGTGGAGGVAGTAPNGSAGQYGGGGGGGAGSYTTGNKYPGNGGNGGNGLVIVYGFV